MRKIVFLGSAPVVGTEYCIGEIFEDDVTDAELSNMAFEYSVQNAEMYGFSYDTECEGDYETCTNGDDIEYSWEEYDPEAHDGLMTHNPFEGE